MNCAICGDERRARVGTFRTYEVMQCTGCRVRYLDPQPSGERLRAIYADYYAPWDIAATRSVVADMKRKTFRGYIDIVRSYCPSGRLLDVGCATGDLMWAAREAGFDVYGVELSAMGVKYARELFGPDRIIAGTLEQSPFPAGHFDVITLSDVIEHIPEPRVFMQKVSSLLKKGGIVMIATPDTASALCRCLGNVWPHYKEEHLYYYDRHSLEALCGDTVPVAYCGKAYKYLNANYVLGVLMSYSNIVRWCCGWAAALVRRLMPALMRADARVYAGELLAIGKKTG